MTDSMIFRIEELNSSLRPRLKKQYYSSQLGLITYLRNIGWLEVNYGFLILIGLWTLPSLTGQKRKFTVWGQTRKVRIPMCQNSYVLNDGCLICILQSILKQLLYIKFLLYKDWKQSCCSMAMAALLIFLFFLSSIGKATAQTQRSNITLGSSISTNSNSSYWASTTRLFAFGFYPIGDGFMVGIWIIGSSNNTIIWTAKGMTRQFLLVQFSCLLMVDYSVVAAKAIAHSLMHLELPPMRQC